MLTAIGLFIKHKMFSGTGLIVTLFGLIFALFLFSNANVILSKFGFETTTVLKSELTKTKGELNNAVTVNQELNKTVDKVIDNGVKKEEALIESFTEREKVKDKVVSIKKEKAEKVKQATQVLDNETTVTEEVIKIPVNEYNQNSEANINSIHEAFNEFFPEGENHA